MGRGRGEEAAGLQAAPAAAAAVVEAVVVRPPSSRSSTTTIATATAIATTGRGEAARRVGVCSCHPTPMTEECCAISVRSCGPAGISGMLRLQRSTHDFKGKEGCCAQQQHALGEATVTAQ